MRVQAGRDAIFDLLENQFHQALHQDGGEGHMARHSRTFRYRNGNGCLLNSQARYQDQHPDLYALSPGFFFSHTLWLLPLAGTLETEYTLQLSPC